MDRRHVQLTEPTAWCLLALKQITDRSGEATDRIDEAERLLFDRMCVSGGWNYGNASVLGQELNAYVPTTALGLLALQDRQAHHVVARSLSFLETAWPSERSGTALGLTALCLRVYGRNPERVEQLLHQRFEVTEYLNNVATWGLALYALTAQDHDGAALRID